MGVPLRQEALRLRWMEIQRTRTMFGGKSVAGRFPGAWRAHERRISPPRTDTFVRREDHDARERGWIYALAARRELRCRPRDGG